MFPKEFEERMKALLSEKEYEEFMSSFDRDEERHHALRINYLKAGEDEEAIKGILKRALSSDEKQENVPWEKRGFYYEKESAPGKHPYHEAGLYYIQEPSAMSPVSFLDPKPGERVLDLCAAPGGKTTQIADRMKGQGILVTNEINRDRSKILSLNVERLGVRNALVLNEDSALLSEVFEGYFDKILVDAPCSGEGMFRKNDNATQEWSLDNVKLCAARQEEILDNAAKMLLPGGRLVYSTCTFSPEENEENITKFLSKHQDFYVEDVQPIGGMQFCSPTGAVRLWPHKVRGEGHFFCVLGREGNSTAEGNRRYIPGGRNNKAKKEMLSVLAAFLEESLVAENAGKKLVDLNNGTLEIELPGEDELKGLVIGFGDQLYLVPSDMPSINALKVQRCGLHLGTVKKDRFEPSHALALTLAKGQAKVCVDLDSDSMEIRQFLNGQTLKPSADVVSCKDDNPKGWCLVCTDGYSIGWGKLAGGVLKNHYPKGLRINY